MNILEQLAAHARERTEQAKKSLSLSELRQTALSLPKGTFPFEAALRKPGLSFICECKKASPSKGVIAPDFPYLQIAKDYEAAGADAISVLTEPRWFLGSDEYLREIAEQVSVPCLRKDFLVDEYMIYEAKQIGADAILLICAILNDEQLNSYIQLAEVLGLSVLVETHNKHEIERAIKANAKIIGVNNRNLKDFTVDFHNSIELRRHVPEHILFVSESGIHTHEDIKLLKQNHVDAVLIGEAIMKAENKEIAFQQLRGQYEN